MLHFLLVVLVLWPTPLSQGKQNDTQPSVEDVIPLTIGNLRGHRMLYNEGYFVISSSKKALEYAKAKSIDSSRTALRRAYDDAARRTGQLPGKIEADAKDSVQTGKNVLASGTKRTGRILEKTRENAAQETRFAKESFQRAVESFVRGNLAIVRRTKEDRAELAALPGGYYKNLRSDFSDIHALTESARGTFSRKIGPAWEGAFERAKGGFRAEYERSGRQKNSLAALGPILWGWAKAVYHGLLAPATKTAAKGGAAGAELLVVTPLAGAISLTGRTVESLGLTVYYVGKTGIHVLSPTVEGGLLAGLSLLSAAAVPVTYAAGGALGAVNQFAVTAAAPAGAAAKAAGKTAFDAGGYAGTLAYDALSGTTKVAINQAKTGVVLGYNALTALPSHAAMGVADAAVFLVWDGPRLAVAMASGKIRRDAQEHSPGDLPVGAVVDLEKLEQEKGVKVETISTDPAVIKGVLEKLPSDLRQNDEKR